MPLRSSTNKSASKEEARTVAEAERFFTYRARMVLDLSEMWLGYHVEKS